MLDFLYDVTADERAPFGEHWRGPEHFNYGEWHLVALYEARDDGQQVEVYCSALPCRGYEIRALTGKNTIGEESPGFSMTTGSGHACTELAAKMAEAIADGMLGLK